MNVLKHRHFAIGHKSLMQFFASQQRYYCFKPIKRPVLSKVPPVKLAEKILSQQSLAKQLQAKILATGPITIADYMREVLTNPSEGYYMTKDVFGKKGDFITSPEIGQIFGELVAVWCLSEWEKCGAPRPLQLVELGPGRGTLAQDVIRVFSQFGLSDQISLHLVEVSPHLSKVQAARLCSKSWEPREQTAHYKMGETVSGIQTAWYSRIEDVPKGFSIFLAHEFFDALPIHKFQKADGKWREILIDIDPSANNRFRYVRANNETPMLQLYLNRPWASGVEQKEHAEYSVETEKIVENLAVRIEESGGFALIMDYGELGEKPDTFRAFKNHALHDPLVEPGTADLTADVDFEIIKQKAAHQDRLITFGPIEQRDFLKQMGGDTRIEILVGKADSEENKNSLKTGYEMLTSPEQMGARFKFFAMFPKVLQSHLEKFPVNGFTQNKGQTNS